MPCFGRGQPPERLSREALAVLRSTDNTLYVSMASLWECAIKSSIGKLVVPAGFYRIVSDDYEVLGIDLSHVEACASLPIHHRDPFDRLLVVRAQLGGLTLITRDPLRHREPSPRTGKGPTAGGLSRVTQLQGSGIRTRRARSAASSASAASARDSAVSARDFAASARVSAVSCPGLCGLAGRILLGVAQETAARRGVDEVHLLAVHPKVEPQRLAAKENGPVQ